MSIGEGNDLVMAAVNPLSKKCVMVGMDTAENWAEARKEGLIILPVTQETARTIWGEVIPDLYAIAAVKS